MLPHTHFLTNFNLNYIFQKDQYKLQAEQLESQKSEYETVKKQQELAGDQTSVVRITIGAQGLDAAIKLCMDQNNPSAQQFLAEQLESQKSEYETVKKQQELAGDQTSVVRITIGAQGLDAAIKLCMDQNNPSAQQFLARVLEENENLQQAIEFYKKAGRTSKAIKLAKEHHLDNQKIRLKELDDMHMLQNEEDFFMSNREFEKAVGIKLKLKQAAQPYGSGGQGSSGQGSETTTATVLTTSTPGANSSAFGSQGK